MAKPDIGQPGWRPTEVHPLAALFPMLAPDDMESLAEHIKTNGLQNPIVIDAVGVLIDGRNRLAACEAAGIEPRYEKLNGHDAEAFIWGANAKRRHMTKGQTAMVAAMGFNENDFIKSEKSRGRPSSGKADIAKAAGITQQTLQKAFLVKEHAQDLAQAVIDAIITLDAAYVTGQARQKEASWRDDGLNMLRKAAPDLAARVNDGEIDLAQGRKELDERHREEVARRDSMVMGIASLMSSACNFEKSEALKRLPQMVSSTEGQEHFRRYFPGGIDELKAKIEEAQRGLDAVKAICADIPGSKRK